MAAIFSQLMSSKPGRLMSNQDGQEAHIKDVHMSHSQAEAVLQPQVVIEKEKPESSASELSEVESNGQLDGGSEDDNDEVQKSGNVSDAGEEEDLEGETGEENDGKVLTRTSEEESADELNDDASDEDADDANDELEEGEDDEGDGGLKSSEQQLKRPRRGDVKQPPAFENDESDEEEDSQSDNASASDADGSESDTSMQWDDDEGSDASDVVEQAEKGDLNSCVFCDQDEEHDPSEEFEEYLACAACGDNAHRQCARDVESLVSDDDSHKWRCPTCIENGIESQIRGATSPSHRRASAPKITRDLLPVHQGANREGAHSIFNTLILRDDPMDGSRSLRKRKSSELADEKSLTINHKRRRTTDDGGQVNGLFEGLDQSAIIDDDDEADIPGGIGSAARPRSARARAQRKLQKPIVSVLQSSSDTLLMSFNLHPSKLANLANERRKRKRRDRERERRARLQHPEPVISHYPALQPSSFATPYYSLFDKDGDENRTKPYGGILTEEEADTTVTFPQSPDRRKFEDARQKAEEEWRKKMEAAKAKEQVRLPLKAGGPPSKIKSINFGGYEIDTWHAAPYPEEYSRNRVLYICEFCLRYLNSDFVAWRHKLKCPARHPPGDEIYKDGQFSFFEVDGRKNPVYCQNLCLLAKLFLGSKTLYYDVEPFLFYVMTENDEFGCHFVGYFSKEKRPSSLNNVSCILVLPIHQRRGFGHMLIEFSYLLTRVEKKTGSPEKPLSDMGLVSYRSYWRLVLCYDLLNQRQALTIAEISDRTGMTADDIVCALEGLRALVRDPITKSYALRLDYAYFRQYIENHERKGYAQLNPEALTWVPYVMGRDNLHYENAAPLHTVAQRDEEGNAPPEEGVQLTENGVSEKDYAETKTEGNTPSASTDLMTPQEELPDQMGDTSATPFPSFGATSETQESPGKAGTKVLPSTPWVNGNENATSPIPATRFEVFPPVPGSGTRKRPGRPPLGRGVRRGSLLRRAANGGANTPLGTAIPSTTRSRSKLSEAVNGISGEDEDEDHDANEATVAHGDISGDGGETQLEE